MYMDPKMRPIIQYHSATEASGSTPVAKYQQDVQASRREGTVALVENGPVFGPLALA